VSREVSSDSLWSIEGCLILCPLTRPHTWWRGNGKFTPQHFLIETTRKISGSLGWSLRSNDHESFEFREPQKGIETKILIFFSLI
jgi:hypothetical protein